MPAIDNQDGQFNEASSVDAVATSLTLQERLQRILTTQEIALLNALDKSCLLEEPNFAEAQKRLNNPDLPFVIWPQEGFTGFTLTVRNPENTASFIDTRFDHNGIVSKFSTLLKVKCGVDLDNIGQAMTHFVEQQKSLQDRNADNSFTTPLQEIIKHFVKNQIDIAQLIARFPQCIQNAVDARATLQNKQIPFVVQFGKDGQFILTCQDSKNHLVEISFSLETGMCSSHLLNNLVPLFSELPASLPIAEVMALLAPEFELEPEHIKSKTEIHRALWHVLRWKYTSATKVDGCVQDNIDFQQAHTILRDNLHIPYILMFTDETQSKLLLLFRDATQAESILSCEYDANTGYSTASASHPHLALMLDNSFAHQPRPTAAAQLPSTTESVQEGEPTSKHQAAQSNPALTQTPVADAQDAGPEIDYTPARGSGRYIAAAFLSFGLLPLGMLLVGSVVAFIKTIFSYREDQHPVQQAETKVPAALPDYPVLRFGAIWMNDYEKITDSLSCCNENAKLEIKRKQALKL